MPTYIGGGWYASGITSTDASTNYTTFNSDDTTATPSSWRAGSYYAGDNGPVNCPQRVGEGPATAHDPPRMGQPRATLQVFPINQADERAEELLRLFLTEEQLAELEEHGWFTVQGRECAYRIKRGRAGNVQELDEQGRVAARWCIHPRQLVPTADTMLAQKLLIEADEEEFREIGNRSPQR